MRRFCVIALLCFAPSISIAQPAPKLVNVRKIWDQAPHNAFTDLVRWNGRFYCAFREGAGHAGDQGKLRIIVSADAKSWSSAGTLASEDYDLRDAALSVTPDGRMMVMGGAQSRLNGSNHPTGTFVSFTGDGESFSSPDIVLPVGRWLWRVTWLGDQAYGVSYGTPEDRKASRLHTTRDGKSFNVVAEKMLDDGEWPTEARIRFGADKTAYCLHRRDGSSKNTAMLGTAQPPYDKWQWNDLGRRLGGPNFLQLPDGRWIACGRLYGGGARTELLELDIAKKRLRPILRLPSGGDTSYPGMVWHDGKLWVSYYSSHENRTSIYLAEIDMGIAEPIDVGERLELFVDRHLIARTSNCDLRLHQPAPAEKVLTFDQSWEGPFCGYVTVLKDESIFRMYYRGLSVAGGDGTNREVTCYAESNDGIHWRKPDLRLYQHHESDANNITLAGQAPVSHNFSPFLDANPSAQPEQRYKALGGTESSGLIAFASADGKSWRRMQPKAVFRKGLFDSQNVSFWSPEEKKYVCYFRSWTKVGYQGFRTVSRTTSDDFLNWSDPQPMEFGDRPMEHLYTNQTGPYFRAPHILLSTAARFMPAARLFPTLMPND